MGITRPCVKLISDQGCQGYRHHLEEGLYLAKLAAGPVLVDIPKDITNHKCEYDYPKSVTMRPTIPLPRGIRDKSKSTAT